MRNVEKGRTRDSPQSELQRESASFCILPFSVLHSAFDVLSTLAGAESHTQTGRSAEAPQEGLAVPAQDATLSARRSPEIRDASHSALSPKKSATRVFLYSRVGKSVCVSVIPLEAETSRTIASHSSTERV
jgi:hypothetical protein